MTSPESPRIVAVIATWRRDRETARLLEALAGDSGVSKAIVADNAASQDTADLCAAAPLPCSHVPLADNRGPGTAWNAGIRHALQDPDVTHILVLDDDVVPPPGTVAVLLQAMSAASAAAAAPLLLDESGMLWAFPEPQEQRLRHAIRKVQTPEECRTLLGDAPHPFCWATGACMLYARRAFGEAGFFREDFWMLGEDLEYSMRVSSMLGGVFTARAAVPHLPPPPADPAREKAAHRVKFLALLQNLSCLAFHSPHSAHMMRYLPGNFRRYLCTEGCRWDALCDGAAAFWRGAILRQPAGSPGTAERRARIRQRLEPSPKR